MNKILPIAKLPISTFPSINAPLAIALAHKETIPWFYNKFVQIYGTKGKVLNLYGCFIDGDASPGSCPFITRNVLRRDYIDKNFPSFTEFALHCINSDYYPYVFLNRFYIECSENYMKNHFPHQMFLCGYNDVQNTFLGADFFHGVYEFKEISFENIEKGYQKYSKTIKHNGNWHFPEVIMYGFKQIDWKFDFEILISSLEDYLYERDSTKIFYYWFPQNVQKKLQYGLAYYKTLLQLLSDGIADIRAFHILYEHKKMMNMRLEYLSNTFNYTNSEVSNAYKKFEEIALIMRNIILKCNFKKKDDCFYNIKEMIEDLKSEEIEVLYILIDSLKKFIKDRPDILNI